MNKLHGICFLLLFLTACSENKKQPDQKQSDQQLPQAIRASSKYPDGFNEAMDSLLRRYQRLSEALVNWDTARVTLSAELITHLDAADPFANAREGEQQAELRKSAPLWKQFMDSIRNLASGTNLTMQRRSFDAASQTLFTFFQGIQYDNKKLYLQECPMAFPDGDKTGVWLSEADIIRNPYLGLHHPKYKAGMLECGENKSTIDFQNK